MSEGSAGALGFVRGSVARHASTAASALGRSRLSATRKSSGLCEAYAVIAALKSTESSVRICVASMAAWLALVRVEEAFASESDDSVPHLAAAYPDHAAMIATSESSTASAIDT